MKKSYIYIVALSSIFSAIGGSIITVHLLKNNQETPKTEFTNTSQSDEAIAGFTPQLTSARTYLPDNSEDFVLASNKSQSSVVFIQTLNEYEYRTGSWLDWFFEPRNSQQIGSGSGVILSKDGYIVTNNHVIDDADRIQVVHGKRTYDAELVGTDPSTDLAVIKVNVSDLPPIAFGNSDDLNVGEWVLAVGNPFNLTSTVTAGIVSAKGRNINILKDKFPIESFIQTDAAINPGNSGGALVNTQGELVGINTAILSRTGTYAGYGFSVPSNIVKKVYEDIKRYGEVQKAFTGAEFVDINSELADRMELQNLNGVIVANVQREGAAASSNLEKGDVIRSVNGKRIESKAYLEEMIGNLYPGDKLNLTVEREGKQIEKSITLTNREGGTGILKREIFTSEWLGARFENVSKVERDLLGIKNGIKVIDYKRTGPFAELGIPEGFIVTNINNTLIESPKEFAEILEKIQGRVIIAGIDKRGRKVYYPYRF
ncbi:trypsin-like peptidase domain-containing protein [Marinoscillum pacificum]|uniref:trypsin-like peptidase domain-containing protein n=1 Tax=Marinoscillum pacificum TaxID=392723 RepID=UPI0021585379|nr:trypsin-like peptidase domain-containing protein [Marinoscillum pacificum]